MNLSCCTDVITQCVCAVQVDTSAANSTSEGLMWLRLVQSARDKEEQNLEAYVKNGQLFYRSLRRIEKDEELLVWYGKDLIDLLLLSSSRAPAKSKGESTEIISSLHCKRLWSHRYIWNLISCIAAHRSIMALQRYICTLLDNL